ncbi:MAG: exodeoxyribonuclease V subunit gamma [Spirochaetales bacterium]|nr:exodeoxyribonuclease V subunit gamma [Spirochaetales bacterium]
MRLYTCNDLSTLCNSLQENLQAEQVAQWDRSPLLVVPNRNLRRFIQLRLADRQGIAAHIKFLFLEQALLELLGTDRSQLLTEHDLFFLFSTALLESRNREWQIFRDYLGPDDHPARAGRSAGLARSLVQAFRRMEYQRNFWLAEALEQRAMDLPPAPARPQSRTLQAELAFFAYALRELGPRLYPERKILSSLVLASSGERDRPQPLHVFGFSQISRFHLAWLKELAGKQNISLYMLELTTPSADGRAIQWSKPSRENLQLIQNQLEPESIRLPATEYREHLLGRLQRFFALGTKLQTQKDRSIEIAACPGRRREVETVYQNILYNLKEDPGLQLHDIAVLTTDMASYRPLIETVFGASYSNDQLKLPYNLTDFSLSDSSHLARGVRTLFKIIDGNASRENLFELFFNPCFLRARGLAYDDVQTWLGWVEELGAFHNRPGSPFNFDQALERLTLGTIMQTESVADPFQQNSFRDRIPLRMLREDPELVSAFTDAVHDLLDLSGKMKEQDPGEYSTIFIELLNNTLKPTTHPLELAMDQNVRDRLRRWQNSPVPPGMDSAFFREFILSGLDGPAGGRGSYLTDGITICSLQPMRPLPFRILYIMGLAEGQFPGQLHAWALDPLTESMRSGDATGVDENKNLFLEMIFAARDRLIMTYTAEDPHDERTFNPCSVLLELMNALEEITGTPFRPVAVPLQLWDPPDRSHEFYACLTAEEQSLAELSASQPRLPAVTASQNFKEGSIILTHGELYSFLSYPVREQLKRRCGLRSPQRPLLHGKDAEPLYSRPGELYALAKEAFHETLRRKILGATGPDLEETALALYRREQKKSHLPERHFGDLEMDLLKNLLPELPDIDGSWMLRLEITGPQSGPELELAGPDGRALPVRFEGWLPFYRISGNRLETIQYAHKTNDHYFLWPFLFFQIWNLTREDGPHIFQSTIAAPDGHRTLCWEMTPVESHDYLQNLSYSLLYGPYYPLAVSFLLKQKDLIDPDKRNPSSFIRKLKEDAEESRYPPGLEELVEVVIDDGVVAESWQRIGPFLRFQDFTPQRKSARKSTS